MGTCEFCGAKIDLPFRCNFGAREFCIEHRLPENHSCSEAPERTPMGPWKTKKALEAKINLPIPSGIPVPSESAEKKWTKHKAYGTRRNAKKIVGIVGLIGVAAIAIYVFAFTEFPTLIIPEDKSEVDTIQKIKVELGFEGSILNYDWTVWSRTASDSGMILTQMDT